MANNRMWLQHAPTGLAVCLGKRMAWGIGRPAWATAMITTVWYLVFKVVALTHFGSELIEAEFETKAQCLTALQALHAGRPIEPYREIGIGDQQPDLDFLFCTDSTESGG